MYTVLFEGLDRAGKSTLRAEFEKQTKYKYVTMDRGHISVFVYNAERTRKMICASKTSDIDLCNSLMIPIVDLCATLEAMSDHTIIVRAYANPKEIDKRLKATAHEPVDVETHEELFHLAFGAITMLAPNVKVITIDTDSGDSIENSVQKIIERVTLIKSLQEGE